MLILGPASPGFGSPLPLGERDAAPALAERKCVLARLGEGCVLGNLDHKSQ